MIRKAIMFIVWDRGLFMDDKKKRVDGRGHFPVIEDNNLLFIAFE